MKRKSGRFFNQILTGLKYFWKISKSVNQLFGFTILPITFVALNNQIVKKNQLKGIFTELIETSSRKSAFSAFIENEDISSNVTAENTQIGQIRKKLFADLQKLKSDFVHIIEDTKVKQIFARLARLETAIVQHRSILDTEVKLTLLNQKRGGNETSYVVARAPFYNPNNVKAEIRVYLGKTEDLGSDLVKLANDSEFMRRAELELVLAMMEYKIKDHSLPGLGYPGNIKFGRGKKDSNTSI